MCTANGDSSLVKQRELTLAADTPQCKLDSEKIKTRYFFLCSFTRIFTDDGTFSLEEVETVKQKMFVFESWVKKAWLFYISQQHEVIYNIAYKT